MLDTIRNATDSWIAKVFLGILILCFVLLWGVPELQRNSSNVLLTSGKSTINMDDYNFAYGDNSIRISSLYGRMLSQAELQQNNVPAIVLNKLQQDVLLDEQARLMKIGVSKDGIAKAINDDQLFYQDDVFNRNLFLSYLQEIGDTKETFVRYYAAQEKRQQLTLASVAGIKAPDVFYSANQIYTQETRNADYIVVTPEMVGTIADPEQTTLETWFKEHQDQFQAPEYRKVTLMQMNANILSKPEDITADEAKAYYEQNISTYSEPEKRTIELLRFQTRAEADAAAEKLKNGTSFEALVTEQNKTLAEINSGSLAKTEFPTTYSSYVFDLKQNEVSNVINDIQGPLIIRLVNIQPTTAKDLATVEQEIRVELANRKAVQNIRNNYDSIEDSRYNGVTLSDIAKQYNLTSREVTIDAKGNTLDGKSLTDLPEQTTLITSIFQANEGTDLAPIAVSTGGYVWYNLDQIIASRPKTLEEVHDAAVSGWKAQELQRLLDEKANELLTSLKNGETLDSLATTLNQPKQQASLLQRGKADAIFGSNGVNAVFSGAKGYMDSITGANADNRIVFVVTESVEPLNTSAETLKPEDKTRIDSSVAQDLIEQVISYARQQHPFELNSNNYNLIINSYQ